MKTNLNDIEQRHGRDMMKDALFILLAVLLTAVSIASVTGRAIGRAHDKQYQLSVVETPELAK